MVYSSIEIGCGYEGLVTLSSILWSCQYTAYNEKQLIPGGEYTSKHSASKDRKCVSMLMCEQLKKIKSDVKGRK
jgi:hypothetical protein